MGCVPNCNRPCAPAEGEQLVIWYVQSFFGISRHPYTIIKREEEFEENGRRFNRVYFQILDIR